MELIRIYKMKLTPCLPIKKMSSEIFYYLCNKICYLIDWMMVHVIYYYK